jgi:hypothetical protein
LEIFPLPNVSYKSSNKARKFCSHQKYNFLQPTSVFLALLKDQQYLLLFLKMSSSPIQLPACTGWALVWYHFGEAYGSAKTEWKFNALRSRMTPEEIGLIDAKYREVYVKLSQQFGVDQMMAELSKVEEEINALELIADDRLR